jgi:hypothetical protein
MVAHGKGRWLPCVLDYGARQRDVIAVHFRLWRTGKASDCRAFFYRRTAKAVTRRWPRRRQLLFFVMRLPVTHGKDSSLCVVRRGARH